MIKFHFGLLCALIFGVGSLGAQDLPFRVIALKGDAYMGSTLKEAKTSLKVGTELPVGTVIRTGDTTELMLQQKGTFNIFQVKPKSMIRVDKSKIIGPGELQTAVHVNKGTLLFNAAKVKGNGSFELDSPLAVGSVRGTQGYMALVISAPFTPSSVAGVPKGATLIVYTAQGIVAWSAKNGVMSYKEIVDEGKGMKIPKSVVKAMFEFQQNGTLTSLAKGQAFLFIPEDGTDKDLLWDEPDMDAFASLINSLGEAGFFDGPPVFGPSMTPGEELDTQNTESSPVVP